MNFFIYLINEGLSKVLPFVTILIIANYVDVGSFGQLTIYYIILEILTIIVSNNIKATTRIDFFQLSKDRYVKTKTAHTIASFILLLIVVTSSLYIIESLRFQYIVLLSVTAFMRGVGDFILSDLQCREKVSIYGLFNLIPILFSNILFIIAILFGYSIESWFYTVFSGVLLQFFFSIRYIKNNRLLIFSRENILNYTEMYSEFKHGLIFMPQAIGFWVNSATDRLFISNLFDNLIVGYYMFIFQLSTPIIMFATVVNLYLTPKINMLLKENKREIIQKTLFKFVAFTFLFTVVNYFFINILINYFYYEKYSNSLEYIPLVVSALFLQAVYLIYMNIFYYIGKKKFISILVLFISVMKVIIVYFSLSSFGMHGLLYANIVINITILLFVLNKINTSLVK